MSNPAMPVPDGSPEKYRADDHMLQDDLGEVLRLLGLGDHARPKSPHRVFQDEVLPAIRKLVNERRPTK